MKKYLITGSLGFIGKNLKEALGLKNKGIWWAWNEGNFKKKEWGTELELVVKEVDAIFHVGAISSTDAADINKTMFLNYEFSKILFDLAAKYNKKVVYSSSAAIYGKGDGIPCNLYAWTKKAAEDYGLLKVKDFISLRYFNVYGPGECHKGKMASVARQAFVSKYFSSNPNFSFPLFPKGPRRDFVYVKDVVDANLFAAENEIPSGIYEVGSGESRPFEDVLDLLHIKYYYLPEENIPAWYQFETKSNPEKYMPHWKPKFNLEKGMKEYKEYLEKYIEG